MAKRMAISPARSLALLFCVHAATSLAFSPLLNAPIASLSRNKLQPVSQQGGRSALSRVLRTTPILPRMTAASSPSSTSAQDATQPAQAPPPPLDQNWWPVALTYALKKDRPHHVQLLEQDLVVWHDGNEWLCMRDACSHRFAPLSEGRVLPSGCLQCAYHGWEFGSDGSCQKVPQSETVVLDEKTRDKSRVPTFLTQEVAGMLWVWPSHDTAKASETVIPVSALLSESLSAAANNGGGFMRDLPYGIEILGENLLDLAHLPYSHHGLGTLNRELGGKLPLRMIAKSNGNEEKTESHVPEATFGAQVLEAAKHDPVLSGLAKAASAASGPRRSQMGFPQVPTNASVQIKFFAPSHVRYERTLVPGQEEMTTNLFMSPTSKGRSRVFLFEAGRRGGMVGPQRSSWQGHLFTHVIFDGDGIFLAKQSRRMRALGLAPADYFMPSSSDILVIRYRNYMSAAAAGSKRLQHVISEGEEEEGAGGGGGEREAKRREMLDRYESHTKNCPECSLALHETRAQIATVRERVGIAHGVSLAGVAFIAAALASLLLSLSPSLLPPLAVFAAGVASLVGSHLWQDKAAERVAELEERERKFIFKDYVHADMR